MQDLGIYAWMFGSGFLAASVIPAQSEALFTALLLKGDYSPWLLLLCAGAGNTLGSVVNWTIGRWIDRFRDRKWFPVKPAQLDRAQAWYQRYGRWSLLLSWVPFIGDPLTLAAGVMREKLIVFIPLVALAKTGRYVAVMAVLETVSS